MASGGSGGRGGKKRPSGASRAAKANPAKRGTARSSQKAAAKPARQAAAPEPHLPAGPFRLGVMPGATPGKWADIWQQRLPQIPLELVQTGGSGTPPQLRDGSVDAALVRLPLEPAAAAALHVIALYEELAVVVCGTESHLSAADELTFDDLAGEVLIRPTDEVFALDVPGTAAPRFAPPADAGEAIATVAAGVGIVIVPMSLARLHHRRDVTFRPLVGGPRSPVALVWPRESENPLVEVFVGIVRGRTANSSRG